MDYFSSIIECQRKNNFNIPTFVAFSPGRSGPPTNTWFRRASKMMMVMIQYSDGSMGGDHPCKRAWKIFWNVSERKSSNWKLSLIPSMSSAYCRVALSKVLRTFLPSKSGLVSTASLWNILGGLDARPPCGGFTPCSHTGGTAPQHDNLDLPLIQ